MVSVRMDPTLTEAIEKWARQQGEEDLSRSEAIRKIVTEHLAHSGCLDRQVPANDQPHLDSDEEINELYKQPGMGSAFFRAMINHMHTHRMANPDITVDQVREFVIDLFDNYDQDLGAYMKEHNYW